MGFVLFWHSSRKAEITEFDTARGINEEISRLQVPMDNVGRMQKVESTQRIVDNC